MLLSWHIAETRERARIEARDGLQRHHNEYVLGTLQRPGLKPYASPDEAVDKTAFSDGAAATIGTPDDLVAKIRTCCKLVVVSARSWDSFMIGRTPRTPSAVGIWWHATLCQRSTATSMDCGGRRGSLSRTEACSERSREAVMAKIMENENAAAALAVTKSPHFCCIGGNVPDLPKARAPRNTQ